VRRDVRDVRARKERALAAHRSQVSLLWPGQPRPVLEADVVRRFLGDEERFWPLA
jgi:LmbE family N-acetylglucosaminyl deacetylase